MNERVKSRILEVVEKNTNSPLYKIAEESDVSIATVSKYCYILEAENKLKITNFGNMKLVSKK